MCVWSWLRTVVPNTASYAIKTVRLNLKPNCILHQPARGSVVPLLRASPRGEADRCSCRRSSPPSWASPPAAGPASTPSASRFSSRVTPSTSAGLMVWLMGASMAPRLHYISSQQHHASQSGHVMEAGEKRAVPCASVHSFGLLCLLPSL